MQEVGWLDVGWVYGTPCFQLHIQPTQPLQPIYKHLVETIRISIGKFEKRLRGWVGWYDVEIIQEKVGSPHPTSQPISRIDAGMRFDHCAKRA